jgi:hypothetical protein
MKDGTRMLPGHAVDNGRYKTCRHGFGASYSQFSSCGIGEEFEFSDALPKLVENGGAAFEQGTAVDRGLDSLRAGREGAIR